MQIQPANLIPEKYLRQEEYVQICKRILRILTIAIVVLLLLISVIAGICYYLETNRDMNVPDNIKKDFLSAQTNNGLLQKKKDLILKVKNEDSMVTQTLTALLSAKPNDIKLTRLEITNTNTIYIEGFSNDPASFNQYVAQINGQSNLFTRAVVEKIAAATGDMKTFSIKAERATAQK